jgi:hypothetical protein
VKRHITSELVRKVTVKTYAGELRKQGTPKTEGTIRRWIMEGKVEAIKDPGGRNWLIVLEGETTEGRRISSQIKQKRRHYGR